MSAKRQQTMAKIARERAVKERRARKQEKKQERKEAALRELEAVDGSPSEDVVPDDADEAGVERVD
jgi:hypothetical protein